MCFTQKSMGNLLPRENGTHKHAGTPGDCQSEWKLLARSNDLS